MEATWENVMKNNRRIILPTPKDISFQKGGKDKNTVNKSKPAALPRIEPS